jgi:hypothetical protein
VFFQVVAVRLHPLLHRLAEQRDSQVSKLQKLPRKVQGRTLRTTTTTATILMYTLLYFKSTFFYVTYVLLGSLLVSFSWHTVQSPFIR